MNYSKNDRKERPERSDPAGEPKTQSLGARLALARKKTIEDATELDLVQFLLSRGGDA